MIYLFCMPDKGLEEVDLPEGFSGQELRWSLWWIDNRDKLKKLGIIAFIALDALLISIGAWGFLDWLAIGGISEERAIRQLTSPTYAQLGGKIDLREVTFGTPIVLSLPDSKYDIIIPVENHNPRYWVELSYRVVIGGEESPLRETFVLPGQSKLLAELGLERRAGPGQVELKVEERSWHRVDAHEVPDLETWSESRLAIEMSDAEFVAAPTGEKGGVSRFTLSNDTAFSYYDGEVLVFLYRGSALVGANKVRLDQLLSNDSRDMEIYWYQPLPQITRTEVQFDVNIFDPDVYRPVG